MINKFYEQIKNILNITYHLSYFFQYLLSVSIDTNYVVYKSGGSINIT